MPLLASVVDAVFRVRFLWPFAALLLFLGSGCGDGGGGNDPLEVVSTMPRADAFDVSVVPTIVIEFSRPMERDAGAVVLDPGGTYSASDGTWSAGDTILTVQVIETLPAERAIRLTVDGFRAEDGEVLDPAFELIFTTGRDRDPPDLAASSPEDGATGIDLDAFDELVLVFDEDMDTTVTNARVTVGDAAPRGIAGRWDEDDPRTFRAEAAVVGLVAGAEVAVDVTGFTDPARNAVPVDGAGGDGVVSFSTASVVEPPFIEGATPFEGETRVEVDLEAIEVVFSEPMDPSVTGFPLASDDGEDPVELTGSWSEEDRVLTLPVPGPLRRGVLYSLDLRAARDVDGTTLSDDEPFTGDGRLDFLTFPPSGESCDQALRQRDGTVVGDRVVFELPATTEDSGEILDADGGTASCSAVPTGADAVLVYEKTTMAYSDGGALLRVSAAGPEDTFTARLNLEIIRSEDCAPADERFADGQLACVSDSRRWDRFLDVGPGTYWVFVAGARSDEPFPGATVFFEELTDPADFEGESCAAPWTVESDNHTEEDGVHEWSIPDDAIFGFDQDESWGGRGSISCVDTALYGDRSGPDAVIAYEKSDPDTLLRVESDGFNVVTEIVSSGCDLDVPDRETVACERGISNLFEGAVGVSGVLHIWLTTSSNLIPFRDTTVTVEEIDVAEGDACGAGIPLVAGANAVSRVASTRLGAPSCFAEEANVVWYEHTLTDDAVVVTATGDDDIGLVSPTGSRELDCVEASTRPAARILDAGETVCIAVACGAGTSSLEIADIPYSGAGSGARSSVRVRLPPSDDPDFPPFLFDTWLAADGDRAFIGTFGDEIVEVDLATGDATIHGESEGVTAANGSVGGVVVDGALFTIGNEAAMDAARLYRAWDGTSAVFDPEPWDEPPMYPPAAMNDLSWDGSQFLLLSDEDPANVFSVPRGGGTADELTAVLVLLGTADRAAYDGNNAYFSNGLEDTIERVSRADLGMTTARPAPLPVGGLLSFQPHLVTDARVGDASYLYFQGFPSAVYVIADPAGPDSLYLGPVAETGGGDDALFYDHDRDRLVFIDTSEQGSVRPHIVFLE